MPDRDMVDFEANVDKLCASWVKDVNAELAKCRTAVGARIAALRKQIEALQTPERVSSSDQLLMLVNRVLAEDSASIKELIELQFMGKHDAKGRKLRLDGHSTAGLYTKLPK